MQTVEKLTATFTFKLALLFALLLTGVFIRPNKMALPADAKNVQVYSEPSTDTESEQQKEESYYRLVKDETSSISL